MSDNDYYYQERDVEVLLKFLPFLQSRTFLDVGAEKGSFAAIFSDAGLSGICFEPLPAHQEKLKERFPAGDPGILPFAVDDHDHPAEFNVATDPEGKDLDYFHSLNEVSSNRFFKHSKKIPVECRSLASLVAEGLIPPACGILKIDTEGNDLKVLRGLGNFRPEIIVCEFVTPEVYPEWDLAFARNLIPFARSIGYANHLTISRSYKTGEEFIKFNPGELHTEEWGNILFFNDECFGAFTQKVLEIVPPAPPVVHEEPSALHAGPPVSTVAPSDAPQPSSARQGIIGRIRSFFSNR